MPPPPAPLSFALLALLGIVPAPLAASGLAPQLPPPAEPVSPEEVAAQRLQARRAAAAAVRAAEEAAAEGLPAPPAPAPGDPLAWLNEYKMSQALGFLAARQQEDGSFGAGLAGSAPVGPVGRTGLAMLAFLGQGSTMRFGPHKATLKRATIWLRDQQAASGWFVGEDCGRRLLEQTLATYALVELQWLSSSILMRKYVSKGLAALETAGRPDAETLGWQVLLDRGLRQSGREGLPLSAGLQALVVDRREEAALFREPVAVLLRAALDEDHGGDDGKDRAGPDPGTAALLAMMGRDLKGGPEPDSYWYLATQAMRAGGGDRDARAWERVLRGSLLRSRNEDGSYGPHAPGSGAAGKVYSTALALLVLQSPYDGR